MIFFKKIKKHLLPLILVILLIIFAYWSLQNSFFQQDEWQFFAGSIYYESKGIVGVIESFFPVDAISHFNPLGMAYTWITYFLFGTSFTPYAYLSILLHIFNALILYYLVFSWLKSQKIAFVASLFFGLNSIPSQAVTWVAAENSYEIPLIFILFSLIFFQRFLSHKKSWKTNIILSLTMLSISLLFHENGIFLFLFYPLIFFLDADSQRKKMLRFFSFVMAIFVLFFFLVRIPFFFGFITSLPERTDISHPPIFAYPYRLISKTMKSLSGSFFPEKTLIHISDRMVYLGYPQFLTPDNIPNPFIAQSIVFDLTSYFVTILIIIVAIISRRLMIEEKISNAWMWSFLFVTTSFFPYSFVLGKAGYASILEPKFFYVGGIGISIVVAIVAYTVIFKFSKQKKLKIVIYLLLGLYLSYHLIAVKTNLNNLVKIGTRRKTFLTTIKSTYKKLPLRVIFFVQSDSSYYGMANNNRILPVQVGFGKMLMIWYQKDERFPGCLYKGQFLLGLLEEGYIYCDSRGFGYFRQYVTLLAALRENKLSPDVVIAYNWHGKTSAFSDITSNIRAKLQMDLPYELNQ